MKIIWLNEVLDWYDKNQIKISSDLKVNYENLPVIEELKFSESIIFEECGKVKHPNLVADNLLSSLPNWVECLFVITLWGLWPSSEDWPRFYNWRNRNGSKNSIEQAPGHLFDFGDIIELKELLIEIFEFGWEGYMFLKSKPSSVDTIIFISHDGWLKINSNSPVSLIKTT